MKKFGRAPAMKPRVEKVRQSKLGLRNVIDLLPPGTERTVYLIQRMRDTNLRLGNDIDGENSQGWIDQVNMIAQEMDRVHNGSRLWKDALPLAQLRS